jgi:hypothetical protein
MARARLHCCEISPIELLGDCVGKLCAHDQQDVVIAIWRQAVGSREPIKQLTTNLNLAQVTKVDALRTATSYL